MNVYLMYSTRYSGHDDDAYIVEVFSHPPTLEQIRLTYGKSFRAVEAPELAGPRLYEGWHDKKHYMISGSRDGPFEVYVEEYPVEVNEPAKLDKWRLEVSKEGEGG